MGGTPPPPCPFIPSNLPHIRGKCNALRPCQLLITTYFYFLIGLYWARKAPPFIAQVFGTKKHGAQPCLIRVQFVFNAAPAQPSPAWQSEQ